LIADKDRVDRSQRRRATAARRHAILPQGLADPRERFAFTDGISCIRKMAHRCAQHVDAGRRIRL
jgi:hypothetical protein